MTAPVILAGTIRLFLATIQVTARTRSGSRWAMTAQAIKSAWRPAHSVSVAATWTRAWAHLRDTSSAWSFFSHQWVGLQHVNIPACDLRRLLHGRRAKHRH